ncbi:MAG: GGDEF domain-containing protein [Planctomycetes bacterium]|nr:GGDEF domain-containing protein [Planctomycetota bacterium]
MKKISALAALLLGIVPVGTILLAMLDHSADPGAARVPSLTAFLFTLFANLSGIYCLALLLLAYVLVLKVAGLKEEIDGLLDHQRELMREHEDLKNRNDVLTATREVALVLNKDVQFERVLEEVLRIATYIVGTRAPEEICLFVRDEFSRQIRPRARLKDDAVLFEEQLDKESVDSSHVNLVVETGKSFVDADVDLVDITLPLVADREILGAMKVKAVFEGDRDERSAKINVLHRNMEEFSRIVALAIKTPDLYTRTIKDGLTRLFTKRHFLEQLEIYFAQARREAEPLALIFIDIDHFKKVNDTHGHLSGDLVLRDVAATIRAGIRSYSSAYRYGGEEMIVVLPRTGLRAAIQAGERLRKKIEAKTFYTDKKEPLKVTASMGVAEFMAGMTSKEELIKHADDAVYQAKQAGRNRVIAWGVESGNAAATASAAAPPPKPAAASRRKTTIIDA